MYLQWLHCDYAGGQYRQKMDYIYLRILNEQASNCYKEIILYA